jgi:hypothetical protein
MTQKLSIISQLGGSDGDSNDEGADEDWVVTSKAVLRGYPPHRLLAG